MASDPTFFTHSSEPLHQPQGVDYGTMKPSSSTQSNKPPSYSESSEDVLEAVEVLPVPPADNKHTGLHRGLSARQVQMIAIAGCVSSFSYI